MQMSLPWSLQDECVQRLGANTPELSVLTQPGPLLALATSPSSLDQERMTQKQVSKSSAQEGVA